MSEAELRPEDLDELFAQWPTALAGPRWRLIGKSPSPGLLHRLIAENVIYQQLVHDDHGRAVGVLQILCETNRDSGVADLNFMLPFGYERSLPDFLSDALETLSLRKICLQIDEDVFDRLNGALADLWQVGRLTRHTRVGVDRYVDRLVFEFRDFLHSGQHERSAALL